MRLQLPAWLNEAEVEEIFWWTIEVGLTLFMVAMPIFIGASVLGIHPYDSFISTLAPGDLFVYSVVLLAGSAGMGLAVPAHTPQKQTKSQSTPHNATKRPELVRSFIYVLSLFSFAAYFSVFTIVKTTMLQVEHNHIEHSDTNKLCCACASVLFAFAAIGLAACMRHMTRFLSLDRVDAKPTK